MLQRFAIVDTVTKQILSVVEYEEQPPSPPPGFPEGSEAIAHEGVSADWTFDGVDFTPPPEPTPPSVVPQTISDRQFFQQLAVEGIISEDDAISAVATGTIPPVMMPLISSMPPESQFSAKMLLCGATVFERYHPMTSAIGTSYGMTPEQIDNFFIAASLL